MTSRAYCFTCNNYTEEEELFLSEVECQYLVYGREVGEEGTPHLQGFIYFTNKRSFRAIRKLFGSRFHLEIKRGTNDQAIDYCLKDGDVFEKGKRPLDQASKGESQKSKWREIIEKAKLGDEDWLLETYPSVYFRHLQLYRSHRVFDVSVMDYTDTPHEWWYGATGTGKSRKLSADYPDHYPKLVSKWWCGYAGEEVVAIEEWPREVNDILVSYLKKWVDRYKFMAEYKGGSFVIRPPKIIVLSNFSLEESFPKIDDLAPLKRRFKVTKFVTLH